MGSLYEGAYFYDFQCCVGVADRRLCNIKEDEGICSADRHMTGMSCAERYRDVLEACRRSWPFIRPLHSTQHTAHRTQQQIQQ